MLYDVIWLESAGADMDALYDYYVQKSVKVAGKMYNGIIDEVDRLAYNPRMAPVDFLLQNSIKEYRSLVVSKGRYKVVYFIEKTSVYIVHIWSCRRDPEKLKKAFRIE